MIMKHIKRIALLSLSLVMALSIISTSFFTSSVSAKTKANCDYNFYAQQDFGEFSDPCDSATCSTSTDKNVTINSDNKDYAGDTILSEAELKGIKENQSVYEEAAKEADMPWQAIAVIHLRETRLSKTNPANGQGIYQDYAKLNGPYPAGKVDDKEFLRQTIWAAKFLKAKATNPELFAKGDAGQVKDAFFGYNGRAGVYIDQAKALGFDEGYEGSPYVVNKIDKKRDPEENPTKWGQIKADGGSLVYPANSDHGAYVIYASLAGLKSNDCESTLSGTLNENIVKLAEAELKLWKDGELSPGNKGTESKPAYDFQKYTYDQQGDWCAWFVSYILKGAGKPVDSSDTPDWPSVGTFLNESSKLGFEVHEKGDSYKPKPGDFAIYGNHTHINIVTGYDKDGKMLTIGGNQGSTPYSNSSVTENIGYGESATYYVEVK